MDSKPIYGLVVLFYLLWFVGTYHLKIHMLQLFTKKL